MGRGKGGRASGSRTDNLTLESKFEIFTQDDNGVLRTPDPNGKFVGAIENFDLNVTGSRIDFVNDIEPRDNGPEENDPRDFGDVFDVPIIEFSDLTISEEGIEGTNYIAYSISNPELESFGIFRFIFALEIGGEPDLDIDQAKTNIEYIIDNELLNRTDAIFVDAEFVGNKFVGTEEEVGRGIIESNNFSASFEPIPETGGISNNPVFDIIDGDRGNLNDLVDFFGGENGNDSSFL